MLRVGLVCHSSVGGSVRVATSLAAGLAARGHAVHLLSRTPPPGVGQLPPSVTLHRLRAAVEPLHARLQPRWPRAELDSFLDLVISTVEARGLDLLHFHYALPFAEVATRVRERLDGARPRLLMTLHGTDVTVLGHEPPRARAVGRALARLDQVTTVSESHARLSAQVLGLERAPEVIPNFVDLRKFRPRTPVGRAHVSGPHRRPRIVHVSNFRAVKDPDGVARVFARVRERLDAELWLVGDGDGMRSVRSILGAAGVERDVRFFGLRPEIHPILPHGDVLLLTSRTESFCLAALEAAACGLPAVAPRVGGLPEVVTDGKTGLLFRPGYEAEASEALVGLLSDPRRWSEMSRAAVRRAQLFCSDEILGRYVQLYRDALDGGVRRWAQRSPAAAA